MYTYKDQYLYLTDICLNITNACNLACKYCFVKQHPDFMSLKTAKDSVDWLYNNLQIKKNNNWCEDTKRCSINFFGGEPTLMWDSIIVPLTTYIKSKYKDDFDISMTTNGTLLNKEKITFLKDNNIGILLSIDGDKKTQDYNRPCQNDKLSSFDLLNKNIPYILEYLPHTTFRATIYKDTVQYLFENFLFAEKNNFKQCFFAVDDRSIWNKEQIKILKEQITLIYYHYLTAFLNNKTPTLFWTQMDRSFQDILNIEKNIYNNLTWRNNEQKSELRCGLGTNFGSIGWDGSIYACQEQDSRIKTNDIFYLGNIYQNGIEKERHNFLLNKYVNSKPTICFEDVKLCQNCKALNICKEFSCPSTSYDIFNSFDYMTKIQCLYRQFNLNNCLTLAEILFKTNNKKFEQYLNYLYKNLEEKK